MTNENNGPRKGQAPHAVVMVLPHHFYPNEETAADNAFQEEGGNRERTEKRAYDEVQAAVDALRGAGVTVHLFEDEGTDTPDSVFPNNWFSTHPDGRVVLYPMYAPSRRAERRDDIVDFLREAYDVAGVIDYSSFEYAEKFLEGTGAMVLDHANMTAYVSLSHRADETLVTRFCSDFGYDPVMFETKGPDGNAIYHTNVMMNVGTKLALVGLSTIVGKDKRQEIEDRLVATGRTLIDLSADQIAHFAGNALEVRTDKGLVLVLSDTAHASLTADQIALIEAEMPLLPLHVPTIEKAGGSARCMLAGIHLKPKA